MNIVLWIVQGFLALTFIMTGSMKVFQYEKFKARMHWVKDSSKGLVTFIGLSELLGALGLILPYATGIVPSLTPIAASALGLIMILGAGLHIKLKEYRAVGMNVIFLALAIFVAIGRW